jgi:hypothetical protein
MRSFDRELGMEDARGARPFWKFVRNVPHDHFGWPTPGRRFRQISERLNVEDRANDRHEEMIEPDRLIGADRLKEGLIE